MEFLKYIDVVAEGLRRDGKDTTMENYQYAKRRLAGYLQSRGKKDVGTGKVDRELINGFCDYLVFCFCACGMEFSDLCFLKKTDMANGTITYKRRNTGLEIMIRVLPRSIS